LLRWFVLLFLSGLRGMLLPRQARYALGGSGKTDVLL
jgi:hypothetical protein